MSAAAARRLGLVASFVAPSGAAYAEARLIRLDGTKRRLVGKRLMAATPGKRQVARFTSAAMRKQLRPGRYVMEVRTGPSAAGSARRSRSACASAADAAARTPMPHGGRPHGGALRRVCGRPAALATTGWRNARWGATLPPSANSRSRPHTGAAPHTRPPRAGSVSAEHPPAGATFALCYLGQSRFLCAEAPSAVLPALRPPEESLSCLALPLPARAAPSRA